MSLKKTFLATAVGDEGGFAPNFQDNKEGTDIEKFYSLVSVWDFND